MVRWGRPVRPITMTSTDKLAEWPPRSAPGLAQERRVWAPDIALRWLRVLARWGSCGRCCHGRMGSEQSGLKSHTGVRGLFEKSGKITHVRHASRLNSLEEEGRSNPQASLQRMINQVRE